LDLDDEKMVLSGDRVGVPNYEIKPDYYPIRKMYGILISL